MIDLTLAANDRASLLRTVEDLLSEQWDPTQPEDADKVWQRLIEVGIADLIAPEATGTGLGLSPAILVDIFAVTGSHLAPGPLIEEAFLRPWLAGLGWADARDPQDAHLAWIDNGATFDWRGPRGEIVHSGGTLRGVVRGIAHAPGAATILVVSGDPAREQVFVVDAGDPRVRVTATQSLDPGCPIGTVELDEVFGEPLMIDSETLVMLRAWLRLLTAAELLGIAERTVEMTRRYSLERRQFGRPIAGFQAIRHLLADMGAQSIALGNLVRATTAEVTAASPAQASHAALVVKAFAGSTALSICEQALQVHGGIGFVEEHPLHRYFKATLRRYCDYGTPSELYPRIGADALTAELAR